MILSDKHIKKRLADKSLVIRPIVDSQVQGASIDLTLGDSFLKIKDHTSTHLNYKQEASYHKIVETTIVIAPQSFILATTNEYLGIPTDLAGIVEGRSSIGRMGLFIQNAGLITPGFKGTLTLELFNANNLPLVLKAGMRICQILLLPLSSHTDSPYQGKYQGQSKVTGSRLFAENSSPNDQEGDEPIEVIKGSDSLVKSANNEMVDNKPISIASDHAGFALKSKIIDYLTKKNIPYNDLGTYSADSVDYPDYAFKVADSINKKIAKYAILICNTGLGMSIAANRFTGIRAALCADDNEASSAKKHNNANVLVLSAQKLNHQDFSPILGAWLGASFEKGRHERRVNKIENLAKI